MIWTDFHIKLHRLLRSRPLLKPKHRILVAVSGGQDSLCLIRLLLDLQPKWGWELAIAHCDHRWPADAGNAEHLEKIAKNWQVPFYLTTATEITTSEGAARKWRYQILQEIAQKNNYHYIVTGHTKSDLAETLLYNLIRGTGADGMQALVWQRSLAPNVLLVRPLLTFTRQETGEFCQQQQLSVWEDATNQNLQYARNRIRLELLPYLQTNFNPQVEEALAQTGELLRADVEYLESAATELLQQAIVLDTNRENDLSKITLNNSISEIKLPVQLNRQILRSHPIALQRRAMRQVLKQILPSAPNFEHIAKLTALITAPNKSRTDPFPGGAIALVNGDYIYIQLINSP